jgi:hypothetical protein
MTFICRLKSLGRWHGFSSEPRIKVKKRRLPPLVYRGVNLRVCSSREPGHMFADWFYFATRAGKPSSNLIISLTPPLFQLPHSLYRRAKVSPTHARNKCRCRFQITYVHCWLIKQIIAVANDALTHAYVIIIPSYLLMFQIVSVRSTDAPRLPRPRGGARFKVG